MLKNRRAFTIIETLVATGIAGVLTLFAGGILIQGMNSQARSESETELTHVVASVYLNLQNPAECSNRISIDDFDLAELLAEGKDVQVTLYTLGDFVLEGGAELPSPTRPLPIDAVRLENVRQIGGDADTAILEGSIMVYPGNTSFGRGPVNIRPRTAGRIYMSVNIGTGAIEQCNSHSSLNASAETCLELGARYEADCPTSANGCCVWDFSEDLGPIQFCQLGQAGYVDPDTGAVCEDNDYQCPDGTAAGGITFGAFDCSRVIPEAPDVPANAPAQAPASIGPGAPAPPADIEPSCVGQWQTYAACVAAAGWSGGTFDCGGMPPVSGCSNTTAVAVPAPLPAPPPLPPPPATCLCGTTSINNNQYCGFCTLELDYGFGFIENVYEVRQCRDGALVRVASTGVVPVTAVQCNGARRFLNDLGGGRYGF